MKEQEIDMITKGENLHSDYTVIRLHGKQPLYILDKSKEIYNSLFGVSMDKINKILDKCQLMSEPNLKEPIRNLNLKKDEKDKK